MAIGSWRQTNPQRKTRKKGREEPPPGYPILAPVTLGQTEKYQEQAAALEVKTGEISEILGQEGKAATPDSVAGQMIIKLETSGQKGAHRMSQTLRKWAL